MARRSEGPPKTRLEEIRRHRGISGNQLAELAGMDVSALWRVQVGKRSITPRFRTKLARALLVPDGELFAPIGAPIPFRAARNALQMVERPFQPEHAAPFVGARLAAVMADCGVENAARLGELVGAAEADVLDWIMGRTMPPVRVMNRLCTLTGVTLAYLYFGDEDGLLPAVAARLRAALPPDH